MMRTRTVILLALLTAIVWPLFAQDGEKPTESAVTPPSANQTGTPQVSLEEFIKDSPVKPVDATTNAIEQALKETGAITFRIREHQLIVPAIKADLFSNVARSIVRWFDTHSSIQLHTGRKALILSNETDTDRDVVTHILAVLHQIKGGLKGQDNSILLTENAKEKILEADVKSIELCLQRVESISVKLGGCHFILPLTEKSPRTKLAEAILPMVQQQKNRKMQLLDTGKSLRIASTYDTVDWCVTLLLSPFADGDQSPTLQSPDSDHKVTNLEKVPVITPPKVILPGQGVFGGMYTGMGGLSGGSPGTGGLSVGYGAPLPIEAIPSPKFIMGKNLVIAVSEKGDRIWGYSAHLAKWTTLKLDPASTLTIQTVLPEGNVDYVWNTRLDVKEPQYYWAYSSITGGWDKLTLSPGSQARPTIQGDNIFIRDGDKIQLFSARTGTWAPAPRPDDESSVVAVGDPKSEKSNTKSDEQAVGTKETGTATLKILHLQHSSAGDIATILQQLFRDPNLKIVADTRTNSVIVNGPENLQSAIETLAKKLDEEPAKAASPAADVPQRSAVADKPAGAKRNGGTGVMSDNKLWRSNLNDAQAEARRLGRPLLIHFHASWCVVCRRMDSEVLSTRDDMKRALTDRVVGVRIDIDQHPDIAEKYGIDSIPADLLLGPQGNLISRTVGFQPYHSYLAKIAHAETASAEGLQEKYHTEEQKAWELARQLRESGSSDDKLKAKLREAVTNAFSLRQEMHQAELAAFQQRIADLRQKIQARETIKEQVIDHRIQELLDPNLKWKSSESSTPVPKATTATTSVRDSKVNELETERPPVVDIKQTELEGEWSLQSVTGPDESRFTVGVRSRFRGNQWSLPTAGGPHISKIEVNDQTNPKTLILYLNQPTKSVSSNLLAVVSDQRVKPSAKMRASYRLEGDTLSITFEAGTKEEVVHTWKRVLDQQQMATLYLTSEKGIGRVTLLKPNDTSSGTITRFSEIPGGYGLEVGKSQRLRLENLPDHPGKDLILSVDVPSTSPEAYEYLSFSGLPLLIKDEDLNALEVGTRSAKILYVENLKSPKLEELPIQLNGKQSADELDSFLADIRKQGTVLAIVRMTMTDATNRLGELNGEWHLDSITGAGIASHEQGLRCRIENDQWTMIRNGSNTKYQIVLDPDLDPKSIDMTAAKSDGPPAPTSRGIYRLQDDNTLIIAWGTNETVRPTSFDDSNLALHRWNRIQDQDKVVLLNFTSPVGATLTKVAAAKASNGISIRSFALPARVAVDAGTSTHFRLSQFASHPKFAAHTVTIQIPFVSSSARNFLRKNVIPIQFTEEELDKSLAGYSYTKAIYLPHPNPEKYPHGPTPETISTLNAAQGADIEAEARRLGTVLAIVRSTQMFIGSESSNVGVDLQPEPAPAALDDMVQTFNKTFTEQLKSRFRQPLTSDEVVTAIRYAFLPERKPNLNTAEMRAFRKIAEERLVPGGWTISARMAYPQNSPLPELPEAVIRQLQGPQIINAERLEISLRYRPAGNFRVDSPPFIIRKEYLYAGEKNVLEWPSLDTANLEPKAVPLADAIAEFNRHHHTIAGEKQSSLTEPEVMAAIRDWQPRRAELEMTDAEFATFQAIADKRQLPPGAKIDVLGKLQTNEFSIDLWSVRIVIPKSDESGTIALVVRERFIRSTMTGSGKDKPANESAKATTSDTTQPASAVPAPGVPEIRDHFGVQIEKIGVVKEIFKDNGSIFLSLMKGVVASKQDRFEISRQEKDIDGLALNRRFAKVEVVQKVDAQTVFARVMAQTSGQEIKVGDEVVRSTPKRSDQLSSTTAESIFLKSDSPLILKNVQEFQRQFSGRIQMNRVSQRNLEEARAGLKAGTVKQEQIDSFQRTHDENQQLLRLLRAEYATQIKLLVTEAQSQQKALELAQAELKRAEGLANAKVLTLIEVQRLEFAKDEAARRLEQTKTLLDLYRTIEPPKDDSEPIDSPTKESSPEQPKSK